MVRSVGLSARQLASGIRTTYAVVIILFRSDALPVKPIAI